ncbi:MAG: hypothetical protein ACOYLI_07695 [Synechococcus lacustris]
MVKLPQALLALALLVGGGPFPAPSQAQQASSSQFPGRRVGGGTRGECTSRLIAHLLPASNIQGVAQGKAPRIALLEGPAAQTYPLLLNLQGLRSYQLEPMAAGVRLLTLPPLASETRWESSFLCPGAAGASGDPLGFVTTASPPALSLIRPGQPAGPLLDRLAASCGATVPTAELRAVLGGDPLPGDWPEQLPVRCQQL